MGFLIFMLTYLALVIYQWSSFTVYAKVYTVVAVPALVVVYGVVFSHERVAQWRAERRHQA